MLAAVVEVVAEHPFEEFVRDELFRPAGLERTGFIETAQRDTGPLALSFDALDPPTAHLRGWAYRGMGGVLTSASDLRSWCDALFSGRVLPAAQPEWMLTPDRDDYAGGWYVFDTERGRRVVQHGGTAGSFDSCVRCFPEDQVLVVVLCNRRGWSWQVTWGLCELALGERPEAPRPPEPGAWPMQDSEPWLGTWSTADGQRLELERVGRGVRLGGLGGELGALLSSTAPERGRAPSSKARKAAEEGALRVVDELRRGRSDTLEDQAPEHLAQTWPRTVREIVWPAHVARWGALREARHLGTFASNDGKTLHAWIGLEHARGSRAVQIVYVDGTLTGLDLRTPRWPVEARVVLRSRDGTKLELRPE